MRSLLTLSFIGCIISTSFALNNNDQINKRQVTGILAPVTGGGIGNIGDIGGILGGKQQTSSQERKRRSLNEKRGLPLDLGSLLGGLGGGTKQNTQQGQMGTHRSHQQQSTHMQKRDNGKDGMQVGQADGNPGVVRNHGATAASQRQRNKRDLPLSLDGLLGGIAGGAGSSYPDQQRQPAGSTRGSKGRRQRVKRGLPIVGGLIGGGGGSPEPAGGSAQRHSQQAHPASAKAQQQGSGGGLLGGGLLNGVLGATGGVSNVGI